MKLSFRQLLLRSGYRCEYCRRSLDDTLPEKDHIIPDGDNLAVACRRCNLNKGNHTTWKDPWDWKEYPLFSPNNMLWSDHFELIDSQIRGKTNIGRATCFLLFRDTEQYVPFDLAWNTIQPLLENEILYKDLNRLRYWRLRNRFNPLISELKDPIHNYLGSHYQLRLAEYARTILLLETFFTRSTISDIKTGISLCKSSITEYKNSQSAVIELQNILSILYQQRATIDSIKAEYNQRNNNSKQSYLCLHHYHGLNSGGKNNVEQRLREQALSSKYEEIFFDITYIRECQSRINDMSFLEQFSSLRYLADIILSSHNLIIKTGDSLTEKIDSLLQTGGYGTDIDYARAVTLKRRWWFFQLVFNVDPDWDLFIADIYFLKKIGMFNEIRELLSFVMRRKNYLRLRNYQEAFAVIQRLIPEISV